MTVNNYKSKSKVTRINNASLMPRFCEFENYIYFLIIGTKECPIDPFGI